MIRSIVCLLLISLSTVYAKEKILTAFEIMEKVDKSLKYINGLNKIQLTIMARAGRTRIYKGTLFSNAESSLFYWDDISRGRVEKLLYTDFGQNIYSYNLLDKRLYHKNANDRFDRVLNSGFYYVDLSNQPYLDNFTPKISGKEKGFLVIDNIPLDKGKYSKVKILVDISNAYRPKRIDYFDTSGVLSKSLNISFKKIPVKYKSKIIKIVEYASKLEIADLATGSISVLEIFKADKSAKLDSSLFTKDNLDK